MASLRRCNQGRLLVERFRVEEQSIHVEDNGGGHAGQLHIAHCERVARLGNWRDAPLLGVRFPAGRDR